MKNNENETVKSAVEKIDGLIEGFEKEGKEHSHIYKELLEINKSLKAASVTTANNKGSLIDIADLVLRLIDIMRDYM